MPDRLYALISFTVIVDIITIEMDAAIRAQLLVKGLNIVLNEVIVNKTIPAK